MNESCCLCQTCPNYPLSVKKISIKRRNKVANMLREHRQEERNLLIYAQNINLFVRKTAALTSKRAIANEQYFIAALTQQHLFCQTKICMVVNTLGLLSITELAIVTGLYLNNNSIQQVSKDVGYEIAQVYRFAGLAVGKIALALPMW